MENRKRIKFIPALLFAVAMISLTSCNRGMGCPNNFSIGDAVTQLVDQAIDLVKRQ